MYICNLVSDVEAQETTKNSTNQPSKDVTKSNLTGHSINLSLFPSPTLNTTPPPGPPLEALGDGASVGDTIPLHVLLLVVGEVRELDLGIVELRGQRATALSAGDGFDTHDLEMEGRYGVSWGHKG